MNKESNETKNYPPEYLPNREKGLCLFNKKPENIPEDVLELIGENGVQAIHNKLVELIEENKKHYGSRLLHFFGLFYYQEFLDIKSRVTIEVFQMIDNDNPKHKISYSIKKGRPLTSSFSREKRSDKAMIRQVKLGSLLIVEDDVIKKHLPRARGFH